MDIAFTKIDNEEIRELVNSLMKKSNVKISNFFGIDKNITYSVYENKTTILIRKPEHDFYRLYFLSSNYTELKDVLISLNGDKYVVNIPTKTDIHDLQEVMEKSNFNQIGKYQRFYNTNIKKRLSAVGRFAAEDDAIEIRNILYNNFSLYTDYLPELAQIREMIGNRQILVDCANNAVCGVLIYTINGKKCYLNAWIDKGKNGLFLLYKVYNIMIENNIHYTYFWVNSMNTNVIRLHTLMGAKFDGLFDYTFIKIKQ